MTVRELVTKWTLDTKGASSSLKRFNAGIDQVKKSLFVVGAAGAAAAGTLFGIAKSVAKIGDNARKTAQGLGLTTEAYQELTFAAEIGGISQEELAKSVGRLARSASDASRGLETYKRAYDDMGIVVTDANGNLKDSDVLFGEIADSFAAMEDGTKKTALAMEIFGRSGAKLIPTLNQGGAGIAALREEARQIGFVMSDESAQAAEEFNDTIARMMRYIQAIKISIGNELIPTITETIKSFIEWTRANSDLLKQKIHGYVENLISFIKVLVKFGGKAVDILKALTSAFGGLENFIKIATLALLGFVSARFFAGIGNMAMGIFGLAKAFSASGNMAAIAQAKMLLLPILVGVAIAGLLLIFEDIYAFLSGKDSITGRFYEWITATKDLSNVWGVLASTVSFFGKILGGVLAMFTALFTQDWDLFMAPLKEAVNWISDLGGKLKSVFGFGGAKDVETMGPQSAPVPAGMGGPGANLGGKTEVNMNAPVNVTANVPDGTPPEQVGESVRRGVSDALERTFRQTVRDVGPREAY